MTRQEVFNLFITQAQNARQGYFLSFNEKTSCLKPMIDALRADIPKGTMIRSQFDQIRRTISLHSPNDSKKYQEALDFLASNWPNWNKISTGIKVMAGPVPTNVLKKTPVIQPVVSNVAPSGPGVSPAGWEYVAYSHKDQPWTAPVIPPEMLPPLNKPEITRINEALRRAKFAAELARDTLISISNSNWKMITNPDQRLYIDFFGEYTSGRFEKVLDNFKVLVMAFQNKPKIVDLRNTSYGKTCYAACFRHDLRTIRHGSLSLSGKVDMYLGRGFLKFSSSYSSSTDNTVGTLVHEFSHGAINAVDAPPVLGSVWRLTPNLDPNSPDYGASPDNDIQASTETDDKALAKFSPDIAIRNADNYGQFARILLIKKGK